MINLNKETGVLEIEDITIDVNTNLEKMELLGSELMMENQGWQSFKYQTTNSKLILTFRFYENTLKILELFPVITDQDKNVKNDVIHLIQEVGGEGDYEWGNIVFNNDMKANYCSMVLNFK